MAFLVLIVIALVVSSVGFFISIFFVASDAMLWEMFTVMVIAVMITFWPATILTAIYYAYPKKKEEEKS